MMTQPSTSKTTSEQVSATAPAKPKPKAKAKARAKSRKRPMATRWHDGETPIEDLEPHEQLAHQIVVQYRDLAPSVERIMAAELTGSQRLHALSAFNAALGNLGDPNRDPRTAISNALSS